MSQNQFFRMRFFNKEQKHRARCTVRAKSQSTLHLYKTIIDMQMLQSQTKNTERKKRRKTSFSKNR